MQGYKEPSFQDRMAAAKNAKIEALTQLSRRPPVDPAERARRVASQAAKDEALRMKRVVAQEAKRVAQAAKEDRQRTKLEGDRLAAEVALAAPLRVLDEAELKSARDARYAARKARKTRRA